MTKYRYYQLPNGKWYYEMQYSTFGVWWPQYESYGWDSEEEIVDEINRKKQKELDMIEYQKKREDIRRKTMRYI